MEDTSVVITGMGVVCALGADIAAFRDHLFAGKCGLGPVRGLDVSAFPARVGGEVDDAVLSARVPAALAGLDRGTQLGVVAALEAVAQAGLTDVAVDRGRVAVVAGRCQGNLGLGDEPLVLMETLADAVGDLVGAGGPRIVISTACAASTNAIGLGADLLDDGEADVAVVGGADAIQFATYAGFSGLQALSPTACAPYAVSAGLNLGEGGAFLVLERAGDAARRGATALAAVLGYGLAADAHHPTAPDPTGRGALRSVSAALAQAGLSVADIDYVNGHGTGTPANDGMERRVMVSLFADRVGEVPISSTKSQVGHTLGASGAIEAIACVLALRDGRLPPTVNVPPGHEDTLDLVPNQSREAALSVVLTNNYAFGGNNASLIIGSAARARPRGGGAGQEPVVISGLGAVGHLGVGVDTWMERLCSGEAFAPTRMLVEGGPSGGCPVYEIESLSPRGVAAPKLWRQMDNQSRQAVVAARHALNDGGYRPGRDELAACGVFFGTGTGPGRVNTEFELGVLAAPDRPNLLLFPNTTLNAAAGHVCTSLGFKGPTTTIATGDISGLVALRYAVAFVATGRARSVLVVASDELYPTGLQVLLATGAVTDDVARPFDTRADGSVPAAAAVAILVESAAGAAERGVDPYATIGGSAVTSQPGPPGRARTARASLGRALALALERSGLGGRPPAAVVADASGAAARDASEAEAIERVLGPEPLVTSLKGATGSCAATSGLVGVLAAASALRTGVLAPTANVTDAIGNLNLVTRPTPLPPGAVAINATTTSGGAACVVLTRP
jgi:3-oxoacyl-[acyl-carrier-protein] synthase II